jgi:hypothetical protein
VGDASQFLLTAGRRAIAKTAVHHDMQAGWQLPLGEVLAVPARQSRHPRLGDQQMKWIEVAKPAASQLPLSRGLKGQHAP